MTTEPFCRDRLYPAEQFPVGSQKGFAGGQSLPLVQATHTLRAGSQDGFNGLVQSFAVRQPTQILGGFRQKGPAWAPVQATPSSAQEPHRPLSQELDAGHLFD